MNERLATVVDVGGAVQVGAGQPLCLFAGPCVIESERVVLQTAERLARISSDLHLPLVFKSSYEKDNRSTVAGYRGPGLQEGLELLARVRQQTSLPVISDVHRETDIARAAEVLDVVQVPALLCCQTSLLLEAGRRSRAVNLKKGQFLAPEQMAGSVDKVRSGGCQQILLTERGSCFGYGRLVADMTAIPIMRAFGCPVVFDATHIIRRNGLPSEDPRGGEPAMVPTLCRSAVAAGCDALFIETHPSPVDALCDASSMIPLDELRPLLEGVLPIAQVVRR